MAFFTPWPTDVQRLPATTKDKAKFDEKQPVVISKPSELASYRCLADFTATDKLELSLKRDNVVQILQKNENGLLDRKETSTERAARLFEGWWLALHRDQTGFVPGTYLQPSDSPSGAREEKTLDTASSNACHRSRTLLISNRSA